MLTIYSQFAHTTFIFTIYNKDILKKGAPHLVRMGGNMNKDDMYCITDNKQNEPKWQEPVEYISIGVALGVIFTIFIYGGYLL